MLIDDPMIWTVVHAARSDGILSTSSNLKVKQEAVLHSVDRAHMPLIVNIVREHDKAKSQAA